MRKTRKKSGENFKFTENWNLQFKQLKENLRNEQIWHFLIKNTSSLLILLLATTMWQCNKDDYTGETVGVCPKVISTNPVVGAINVVTNKIIKATFNEVMDPATINGTTFLLKRGPNLLKQGSENLIAGKVGLTDSIVSFTPASLLAANTVYTCVITTGARDLSGNALVKDTLWNFNTGAIPIVVTTDPLDGVSNVPLGKTLSAVFSTEMDASTINASTFMLKNGTTNIPGNVSLNNMTVSFDPSSNLVENTVYTATITSGAEDVLGNALAKDTTWSFSTGSLPIVITTYPIDGASSVALDKVIKVGFSKSMDISTINDTTFLVKQGTLSITGNYLTKGAISTFTPTINWLPNTEYSCTMTTGAKDLDGYALAKDTTWKFTTSTAQFTVTLVSNPLVGGKTSGGGSYNNGANASVLAAANDGYTFTNWTQGSNVVSTNANYSFTIGGSITLTANFAPKFTVTLTSNPVGGGITSGGGTFNNGATVAVLAVPNNGYTFTNWTEGSNIVSTAANYSFNISGNRTLTANFAAMLSGPDGVNLGSAGDFAILGGAGVTNTGVSTLITGNVGAFPTATINGLLSGNVNGILYTTADPIVGTAKTDLTTAYNDAQGRSTDAISLPGQLGGLTLAPGLYVNSTSSGISGTGSNAILTLDAGGNANAVWIFKMGSTLITDAGTRIVLAGGAQAKNIYWSVGSSATLGTSSVFYGNILADQSITLTTGAKLYGRALTRIGSVTLDTNTVTKP